MVATWMEPEEVFQAGAPQAVLEFLGNAAGMVLKRRGNGQRIADRRIEFVRNAGYQ